MPLFQSDSVALHAACTRNQVEAARFLISSGSNVNAKDGVSVTVEHYVYVSLVFSPMALSYTVRCVCT